MLCDPEGNRPEIRFNDGKCDPAGRFWAGTMAVAENAAIGSLFCLFADGHVERKLTGVRISNGIVWSLDHRTLYYIDSPRRIVDAFDYDLDTGAIANRRTAIDVHPEMGYPDGATLDAEGMLWIAHFGGARVTRWNPRTGQHLGTIALPASNITSCAFGGPKLDRLYITSASIGLKNREPQAGALFCVDAGVGGIPACEFAG
jgi:sugar lactone lactonase YvrE